MILFLFIIGACFGSFANVVIYRYPNIIGLSKKSKPITYLAYPNSFCPKCKKTILWYHNIPVVSYIFLLGSCFFCKQPITLRYLINELLMGCFLLFSYLLFKDYGYHFFLLNLFFLFSLILFWIDIDYFILPDFFNKSLIVLGLLFNYSYGFVTFESSLTGLILGYLSLWLIFYVHKKITKKDGMGFGDFKLMSAQGAWLGWESLPNIFLYASLIGILLFYLLKKIKGITSNDPIPFGPAIIVAGFIQIFILV